jgi:hypothetical protein
MKYAFMTSNIDMSKAKEKEVANFNFEEADLFLT